MDESLRNFYSLRLVCLVIEITDDTVIHKDVGGLSALDGTIRALAALNLSAQQLAADAHLGAHPVKEAP